MIIITPLMGVVLALGMWWLLTEGWDALLDALPIWLPHARQ
ncbi:MULTISPECIES: hypothetical protein [Planomonospora]|nr:MULTISPECIES: hypothetical protein [Planomonospora]